MKPIQQKCLCCGKVFTANKAQELYCSGKCQDRKMKWNEQRRAFERIYKEHGLEVKS